MFSSGALRARVDTLLGQVLRRRRLLAALSVAAWAAWFLFAVVPEWTGSRADIHKIHRESKDRMLVEAGIGAAWLTRYHEAHGSLPSRPPKNPAGAYKAKIIELCPSAPVDLVRADADWAFCPTDGKVRALARHVTLVLEDGGHATPLFATQNGTPGIEE